MKKAEEIKKMAEEKAASIDTLAIKNSLSAASQTVNTIGCKTKKTLDTSVKEVTTVFNDTTLAVNSAIYSGKTSVAELYNKHGETIENIVINGLVEVAEEKLHDEVFLKMFLEKTYELLPVSMRMVISREIFMNFCLKYKEPLLLKVQECKHPLTLPSPIRG